MSGISSPDSMEVARDDERCMETCLSIARKVRTHFTESAFPYIRQNVRDHELYLASLSDESVGFATVYRKNERVAEISWMAVAQESQRKGVGTALLSRISEDLKVLGVELLEVKTLAEESGYPPYEATRRFYEKAGFALVETVDPYPGWEDGNPCAIYVKALR